jgi:hypothetical protein
MKIKISDKYFTAAILLLATAAVLIAIAILTNSGDITTAALVFSGMVCAMTGIFTLMFSGNEPVDPRLLGIFAAPGCLNLCRIASGLDIRGHAYFLPPRLTNETRVMQFNPISTYKGNAVPAMGPFSKTDPDGLVTIPSCDLLIQDLRKRNARLVIPSNEENISLLLREIIEDVFKIAPIVSAKWHDTTVAITFHDYPLIDVCKDIAQESPGCCTRFPCPICSLCGALIAEGRGNVVALDQCSMNSSSKDVTAIFSIMPLKDVYP